jgi:hypothetical protein
MLYIDRNSYKREVNHSQMARGPSLVGLYAWAECMPSVRLGMEHGACLSSVILGKQAPHVNNWFLRPVVCRALPHSAYAAPLLDGRIRLTICWAPVVPAWYTPCLWSIFVWRVFSCPLLSKCMPRGFYEGGFPSVPSIECRAYRELAGFGC